MRTAASQLQHVAVACNERLVGAQHLLDDHGEVLDLEVEDHLVRRDTAHVTQLADEPGEAFVLSRHHADGVLHLHGRPGRAARRLVQVNAHHRERCVELMGHDREELRLLPVDLLKLRILGCQQAGVAFIDEQQQVQHGRKGHARDRDAEDDIDDEFGWPGERYNELGVVVRGKAAGRVHDELQSEQHRQAPAHEGEPGEPHPEDHQGWHPALVAATGEEHDREDPEEDDDNRGDASLLVLAGPPCEPDHRQRHRRHDDTQQHLNRTAVVEGVDNDADDGDNNASQGSDHGQSGTEVR